MVDTPENLGNNITPTDVSNILAKLEALKSQGIPLPPDVESLLISNPQTLADNPAALRGLYDRALSAEQSVDAQRLQQAAGNAILGAAKFEEAMTGTINPDLRSMLNGLGLGEIQPASPADINALPNGLELSGISRLPQEVLGRSLPPLPAKKN